MKKIAIFVIKCYRVLISPMLAPRCRFMPSCSAYAMEAINEHGVSKGVWLAFKRILKCHPLHAGGYDPVPAQQTETRDPTKC